MLARSTRVLPLVQVPDRVGLGVCVFGIERKPYKFRFISQTVTNATWALPVDATGVNTNARTLHSRVSSMRVPDHVGLGVCVFGIERKPYKFRFIHPKTIRQ